MKVLNFVRINPVNGIALEKEIVVATTKVIKNSLMSKQLKKLNISQKKKLFFNLKIFVD